MKRNETILIVILMVTACLLGTMLVGSWQSQTAYANMSAGRSHENDYQAVTLQISNANSLLCVTDVANQAMLVYGVDPVKKRMDVIDNVNLGNAFKGGSR